MPLLSQNSPLGQKNGPELVHHGNLALSDCCFWKKSAANDECVSERVLPGQYFDSETGLHYNYLRDYDPAIGRYIESDPIGLNGGDLNLYGYALQNPVIMIDPDGQRFRVVERPLPRIILEALEDFANNIQEVTNPLFPGIINVCVAYRCPILPMPPKPEECPSIDGSSPNTERDEGPILTNIGSSGGCECIEYRLQSIR